MYKKIVKPWGFKFDISEAGIYAINISATCQNGKFLGLFGGEDLKIEIDDIKLREIPSKNKPQYYDIPPAWNGSDLKGTEKTIIFILNLNQGNHLIKFIPKRGAEILREPQINKIDTKNLVNILENILAEEKDRQSWITIALIDLPVNFFDAEFTCNKRTVFDSDDVKLIIDGEIQKNSNSNWWGKNWFWQGKFLQGKTQSNRFYVNLSKGIHYVEFWADRKPLLNKVSFDISEKNSNSQSVENNIALKFYADKGLYGERDYNRFDLMIEEIVKKWNDEFLHDKYPVEQPLDPNLVKAIIYQESKIGYYSGGEINIMQVGNLGDPSLETLNGKLTEYWMQNGIEKKLDYEGGANANTPYDSIYWGVRWLYHKAYGTRDGKRYWRDWKEAVQSYGPGPKKYVENVWSIYENGIDNVDSKKSIRLWSIIFIAPLIFGLHGFLYNPKNTIDQYDIIKNKILTENQTDFVYLKNIETTFSQNDPGLFFTILVWEEDWWEKLKIGRLKNNNIQWLSMSDLANEQSILSAKFINLNGFNDQILEIYGKTHVGNGSLYLYEIDNNQIKLILKTRAVDFKNELSTKLENYKKYGYWQCDEVFRDGQLESGYKDLNNDGIDDVMLSGTSDVICEKELNDNIVMETNKIEKVFLWDKIEGEYREN